MMYNRYVPDASGVYHSSTVAPPPQPPAPQASAQQPLPPPPPPPEPPVHGRSGLLSGLLPRSIDTGDLLVLLILLLLVLDGEQEDDLTALLTIAIYLFT